MICQNRFNRAFCIILTTRLRNRFLAKLTVSGAFFFFSTVYPELTTVILFLVMAFTLLLIELIFPLGFSNEIVKDYNFLRAVLMP